MSGKSDPGFPLESFTDVLADNEIFASEYHASDRTGRAARGLAIVTCMDSRVVPMEAVGMGIGDAKIIRNAGARVTQDVLRTLSLATYLLGVNRILIMPHTDCRMAKGEEEAVHQEIFNQYGVDTWSMEFATTTDQLGALRKDVGRVRSNPFLPDNVAVGGAIYDVTTGRIIPQDV